MDQASLTVKANHQAGASQAAAERQKHKPLTFEKTDRAGIRRLTPLRNKIPQTEGWPTYQSTPEDRARWDAQGYEVGLVLGHEIVCLDIDVTRRGPSAAFAELADDVLGPTITRLNTKNGKCAKFYRVVPGAEPMRKRRTVFEGHTPGGDQRAIELLALGQQTRLSGPTVAYLNDIDIADGIGNIPIASAEDFDRYFERAIEVGEANGWKVKSKSASSSGGSGVHWPMGDPHTVAKDKEMFARAVAANPNTAEHFRERSEGHSMLSLGAAICAGFGGDEEYYSIYEDKMLEYGGDNTPELVRDQWEDAKKKGTKLGASYVYDKAREISGFTEHVPTPEDEFGASPPFDLGELQRLASVGDIKSHIFELAMLRSEQPKEYEEIAEWHETLGTIDRAELDRLAAIELEKFKSTTESDADQEKSKRSNIVFLDQLKARPKPNDFVEELICSGQFGVVYGDASVGKSFVCLDLGFHIACGLPWHGRQVDRGGVLYVALEGGGGAQQRVDAWEAHIGPGKTAGAAFAFTFIDRNLRDPRDVKTLIKDARELPGRFGVPLRLILIDTLSRAMAGGNENSSEDMGALVKGVDQLRNETGAAVLVIHHTGKDDARGARGHSLLRAAVDTEIKIEPVETQEKDVVQVTVTKQRDFERGGGFTFRLRKVELGTNHRGRPITSRVVEAATLKPSLTETEQVALDILITMQFDSDAPYVSLAKWRDAVKGAGLMSGSGERKAWHRIVQGLEKKGCIGVSGDNVVPK